MSGLEAIRASVARAPIFAGGPAEISSSPGTCAIETTRCGLSKPSFILSSRSTPPAFTSEPGRYRVIDALATLAFDYPPRGDFFRGELQQFLILAREEAVDPKTALGSYAGAMGAPQFISSSYRNFAVDADGDGHRNLWSNWDDVIGSVANYLRVHGWRDCRTPT